MSWPAGCYVTHIIEKKRGRKKMHKFSVSEMSGQQRETMTLNDIESSAVQRSITKGRYCILKGASSVAFKLSSFNLKVLWGFISFHGRFFWKQTFRSLDSVSVIRWSLLSWSQSIELVHISGHYTNTRPDIWTKHKLSVGVKANITQLHTHESLHPRLRII
jgi:hypothetical protein